MHIYIWYHKHASFFLNVFLRIYYMQFILDIYIMRWGPERFLIVIIYFDVKRCSFQCVKGMQGFASFAKHWNYFSGNLFPGEGGYLSAVTIGQERRAHEEKEKAKPAINILSRFSTFIFSLASMCLEMLQIRWSSLVGWLSIDLCGWGFWSTRFSSLYFAMFISFLLFVFLVFCFGNGPGAIPP